MRSSTTAVSVLPWRARVGAALLGTATAVSLGLAATPHAPSGMADPPVAAPAAPDRTPPVGPDRVVDANDGDVVTVPAANSVTVTSAAPSAPGQAATPKASAPVTPAAATGAPAPTPQTPVVAAVQVVPVEVTGTVVRIWSEPKVHDHTGHEGEQVVGDDLPVLTTWVESAASESFQVPSSQMEDVPDGARVQVTLGVERRATGNPVEDAEAGREVLAATVLSVPQSVAGSDPDVAAASSAETRRSVTVVMVAPAGVASDGRTVSEIVNTVNGPVSQFWSEQSDGAIWFGVDKQVDWITTSAGCSNYGQMWNEAATAAGFSSGSKKHLLLYVSSKAPGCSAGLGTVGSTPTSGGRAYVSVSGSPASVIAHELGHNLSLGHSDGLQCESVSDGTFAANVWSHGCSVKGYRDYYDVMGISWQYLGSLAGQHADRLGVLGTGRVDVTAPVDVTIAPMGGRSGQRVLRIVDDVNVYWVEYRAATGRDAWLASNTRGLQPGVMVRRTRPNQSAYSLLLDGTPSSSGAWSQDWATVVPVGGTFTAASGKVAVRVVGADAGGATVSVAVNGAWPQASTTNRIHSPANASRVTAGVVTFTGQGTAFEGTLLWEIKNAAGVVVAHGYTNAGANGVVGPFQFSASLGAGVYTVAVWAPDESDGESEMGPRFDEVRSIFTVT